jgi:hypothetical protein
VDTLTGAGSGDVVLIGSTFGQGVSDHIARLRENLSASTRILNDDHECRLLSREPESANIFVEYFV